MTKKHANYQACKKLNMVEPTKFQTCMYSWRKQGMNAQTDLYHLQTAYFSDFNDSQHTCLANAIYTIYLS